MSGFACKQINDKELLVFRLFWSLELLDKRLNNKRLNWYSLLRILLLLSESMSKPENLLRWAGLGWWGSGNGTWESDSSRGPREGFDVTRAVSVQPPLALPTQGSDSSVEQCDWAWCQTGSRQHEGGQQAFETLLSRTMYLGAAGGLASWIIAKGTGIYLVLLAQLSVISAPATPASSRLSPW